MATVLTMELAALVTLAPPPPPSTIATAATHSQTLILQIFVASKVLVGYFLRRKSEFVFCSDEVFVVFSFDLKVSFVFSFNSLALGALFVLSAVK